MRYSWQKFGLTLAALSLWGCNQEGLLEDSLAPDPRLTQQPAVLGGEGNDANVPEGFPTEIPLYPGATLIQAQDTSTVWAIADEITQVETFYRETLAEQSWEFLTPDATPETQFSELKAKKNNLEITLTLPKTDPVETPESEQAVVGTTYVLSYEALATQPVLSGDSPPTQTPDTEPLEDSNTTPTEPISSEPTATEASQFESDLAALGVFDQADFQGAEVISRRQFARWLLTAHNKIYGDRPNLQIRLAGSNSKAVFTDVPSSDPDFAVIQGLAEAGLIPSSLTNSTSNTAFRPDAPLNRETLVTWKVPLDRRQALPQATIDQIKETWGFQDAAQIESRALQALFIDFQNSDKANVRRMFGYTTLFQPKKSVTQSEAAIALWYFGFQGDGISAAEVSP